MSEKIIAGKLTLDTSDAGAKIKEVNTELGKTSQALTDTNKTAGESSGHFANLKNSFAAIPGPLGQAAQATNTFSDSLKAMLANPVVLVLAAIVGALTLLYKAFASTNDGAEKVEQVFKGLGAILTVLRDRVLLFAQAAVKVFKGDFTGAVADAKASVNGFSEEASRAYNTVSTAIKAMQEAQDEANQVLSVSRAKLNRDLAATKELITDETAGYKDRKKAIDEVRVAEDTQTNAELANAEKTLAAIQKRNSVSKQTSDEDLNEAAQAQAKVFAIQEESAQNIRNLNRQEKLIDNQERQKDLAEHQKYLDAKKQQQANYTNYVNQLTKLRQDNEVASITDTYAKQVRQLELGFDNEKKQLVDALTQQHLTREQFNNLTIELDKSLFLKRNDLFAQHQTELLALAKSEEDKRKQLIEQAAKAAQDEAKSRFDQNAANRETAFGDGDLATKQQALDSELALYKSALDAKLVSDKEYTDKVNELAQKRMQIAEIEAQAKVQLANSVGNALMTLSDLVGKQTVVGKVLAIATATMNTWQGATEALKQKSVLPSPFDVIAKIANVAAVVASGLNSVRQIIKVSVPGGGSGGGVSGGISAPGAVTPSAPITPQQNSTLLDQSSINGIGDATKNRSYVVSSDIEHDRNKTERLNRAARLGG